VRGSGELLTSSMLLSTLIGEFCLLHGLGLGSNFIVVLPLIVVVEISLQLHQALHGLGWGSNLIGFMQSSHLTGIAFR